MRRNNTESDSACNKNTISVKRRLALVAGTNIQPKQILDMPDSEIDFVFLTKNKIPTLNIRVCGITPSMLHARGAVSAQALKELGFDSLHFINLEFLHDAVSVYGNTNIVATFLTTPYDAVSFADHQVMQTLSLTINQLVQECAGAPTEAFAILHQLNSIEGVTITTLLDAGIRGAQLVDLGYTYREVQKSTSATAFQMEQQLCMSPTM